MKDLVRLVAILAFLCACVAAGCTSGSQATGSTHQALDEGGTCNLGQTCTPGGPCPDLTIDAVRLQQSARFETRMFTATDCALVEGCVTTPGMRTLLRFDTATPNIGTADMVLGTPDPSNGCFDFSSCHNHYHFNDYAQYTLSTTDGSSVVATGSKRAFCLEDLARLSTTDAPVPATTFNCSNQGIHVGYEDIYTSGLDCQWVDVTGVPPGDYKLNVSVNFAHVIPESSYDNNVASVTVTIPSPTDAGRVDSGPPACSARGGCGTCADGIRCGWCSTTGGCFDGTAAGPTGGSCPSWQWAASQCGLPDAGPHTILDGDFETGNLSDWTSSGAAETVVASGAHGGAYAAMLGSTTPTNGDSSISQTFTAPAGTTGLSVWYKMTCPDTLTYDWATVVLADNTAGTARTVLPKVCTSSDWAKATTVVAAGHSYTVTLTNHDDNFGADPSYTLFDDVVLTNDPPPPPPPSGITNGDFESGGLTGWTASGAAESVASGGHSGAYAAELGSPVPTAGDSILSESFTAPAGSSSFTVWYQMTCPDTVAYDWATVTLADDTTGVSTTLLDKTCTTNTWTKVSGTVTPGHSYTVTLLSHDDNYGADPTYTLFDDVSTL